MNIGAMILIGALISTLLDLVKYAKARDQNGVVTILAGFAVGTGAIFLASAAKVTSSFQFNGHALNDLDAASKVFVGMLATGLFAKVVDLTKAINQQTNMAKPPLVGPPAVPVNQQPPPA